MESSTKIAGAVAIIGATAIGGYGILTLPSEEKEQTSSTTAISSSIAAISSSVAATKTDIEDIIKKAQDANTKKLTSLAAAVAKVDTRVTDLESNIKTIPTTDDPPSIAPIDFTKKGIKHPEVQRRCKKAPNGEIPVTIVSTDNNNFTVFATCAPDGHGSTETTMAQLATVNCTNYVKDTAEVATAYIDPTTGNNRIKKVKLQCVTKNESTASKDVIVYLQTDKGEYITSDKGDQGFNRWVGVEIPKISAVVKVKFAHKKGTSGKKGRTNPGNVIPPFVNPADPGRNPQQPNTPAPGNSDNFQAQIDATRETLKHHETFIRWNSAMNIDQ